MGAGMALIEERSVVRPVEYDPARLLTRSAIAFVGLLILFVASIIVVQILKNGEANTESWAALTGLIGYAMGLLSIIFNNRFGNTQQSAKKDELIARQVTTAAAVAASVAGTGSGGPLAVTPAPMNPETGIVPAAEVAQPEQEKKT